MDAPQSLPLLKKGDRPLVHLALFLATLATSFGSFLLVMGGGVPSSDWGERITGAALFAGSTLAILLAHELGHFILARHHGVDSSLPWFIPVPPPLSPFGTLGAVIRLKGRVPTRDALVDIGAAGPLAGLAVAVPLLVTGMSLSRVDAAPTAPPLFLGNASLWALGVELFRWATHAPTPAGAGLDAGALIFGDNLLVLGVQYLVKGPLPDGTAVYAHPVFVSAWFGMLVTMLNLMPLGQLDGGHLTHAWFGPHAVRLGKAVAVLMGLLALFYSASWLVWLGVTTWVVGFKHPPVVEEAAPLSFGRKLVCVVCLVFFVLCLIPAPVQQGVGP